MTHLPGLHRKPGDEREPHDFYATHPSAIPPLLTLLGWENGGKVIRENSCGQGHLSKALEAAGHTVISTDLIDRGYGVTGVDFLKPHWTDDMPVDAVIMNPPYKHALKFVEKSLTLAPVVCAFLRITFLETPDRAKFFEKHPPRYVAVFSKRMASSKDGKFYQDYFCTKTCEIKRKRESSTVCYAWFVWERGYTGDTVVRWI